MSMVISTDVCSKNMNVNRLEDSGVVTDCSLKTMESDDTLDFNFSGANVVNKVIIKVIIKCD